METWQIAVLVVLAVLVLAAVVGCMIWCFRRPRLSSTTRWAINQYGYSIWAYQQGSWSMVENLSKPGHMPGRAPTQPGEYEEQRVRVISVRAPEAR